MLIDKSLEKESRAYVTGPLLFERLAINQDQTRGFGLLTKPRKKGDKRSLRITEKVEAEAMPVKVMRELVAITSKSCCRATCWKVSLVAEESERQHLLQMANRFEGSKNDGR